MKVETIKIKDWDDAEMGLVIEENVEWLLVKHIPVDYVIDGFRLYRKKHIDKRNSSDQEEKVERVLRLKKVVTDKPQNFEFKDVAGTLKWVEDTYGLFEFQEAEESEVYYGRINKIMDGLLIIDFVDADGSMETAYDCDFVLDQIRVISFGSDYHDAVCLLWKDGLTGAVES